MWGLAQRILEALPQTQCTRCGYPDCAGYAQAVAEGGADINQCPPGGAQGIKRLSEITGLAVKPLNPANGAESVRSVAVIDEDWCIGCTLCIKACPADAIIGSNKWMHTVIESYCTGCALCLPVCPVDCISLDNVTGEATGWDAWSPALAAQAQQRYAHLQLRRQRDEQQLNDQTAPPDAGAVPDPDSPTPQPFASPADRKRAAIALAQAKARERRKI